jgi:hypothetical protein
MGVEISTLEVGWDDVRVALAPAAESVAALIERIEDPERPVLGVWNATELAAHLTHAWMALPALVARDLDTVRAAFSEVAALQHRPASGALLRDRRDLAPLTVDLVGADAERDPGRLAARIRTACAQFIAAVDADPDHSARPWMVDGITAPPAFFGAHLLSETLVHGHDIAAASGIPWDLRDAHAAVVLRAFTFPMFAARSAQPQASVPRLTLDLRLAGDRRLYLCGGPGPLQITLGAPTSRPRARMWVRPSAMLLLGWGRRALPDLVMKRQMMVWGTQPWTARRLLSLAPKM